LKSAKTKQTVSTAGIFKKKAKANPHDKKHHRRREVREPTPEPDLVANFQGTFLKLWTKRNTNKIPDGIDTARDTLSANAKATFDDIHDALYERLMASKGVDGSFVEELAEATATLSAPLIHEKIETTTSRDGKRKTEVVEIGKRVATFKKFVEKEESILNESWKHWEELQTEYIELGIEVFGPEVFGEAAAGLKIKQKGFKREMELLDLEHNARVEEFDEEIEDTGPKLLQKMKASEKV
jgi:phosphopantothenoylcysteine decarboxylase